MRGCEEWCDTRTNTSLHMHTTYVRTYSVRSSGEHVSPVQGLLQDVEDVCFLQVAENIIHILPRTAQQSEVKEVLHNGIED